MKTPLPVTLDDLQATARDNKTGIATYRQLTVEWREAHGNFVYKHSGWACSEYFFTVKLAEYNRVRK